MTRTFTLVDDNGDEQTFKIGSDLQAGDVLVNGGEVSKPWATADWWRSVTRYKWIDDEQIVTVSVADNALYAVQSLAPEPELPRVQRGDVIEREDAERVHIYQLVIRTGNLGVVAQRRGDLWWNVAGHKWSDDEISWPVTVIDVPGEL